MATCLSLLASVLLIVATGCVALFTDAGITCLAVSSDGALLATGLTDGRIVVRDSSTGRNVGSSSLGGQRGSSAKAIVFAGSDGFVISSDWLVRDVLFAPGGHPQVSVWSRANGTIRQLDAGGSAAIATSFDTMRVAVASNQQIDIVELSPLRVVTVLSGGGFEVRSIAWSPNGKLIAAVGISRWALWDAERGMKLFEADTVHANMILQVAFTADSSTVVLCGNEDDHFRFYGCPHGGEIKSVPWIKRFRSVAVNSASGIIVASGQSDMGVRVWELQTGRLLAQFGESDKYSHVAVSADGKTIVGARAGKGENDALVAWRYVPSSGKSE